MKNVCVCVCVMCKKEEKKSRDGGKGLLICPEGQQQSAHCGKFPAGGPGNLFENEQIRVDNEQI